MGVEVCGEVLKLYHKLLGWVLGVGTGSLIFLLLILLCYILQRMAVFYDPNTAVGLTHVVPVTQGGI